MTSFVGFDPVRDQFYSLTIARKLNIPSGRVIRGY